MKKVIGISIVLLGITASLEAKLQIRHNYFGDRVVRRPTSVASAEGEVNRLRQQVIAKYDSGIYMDGMGGWSKDRRRALDIQTRLGYTVPERYTWGW